MLDAAVFTVGQLVLEEVSCPQTLAHQHSTDMLCAPSLSLCAAYSTVAPGACRLPQVRQQVTRQVHIQDPEAHGITMEGVQSCTHVSVTVRLEGKGAERAAGMMVVVVAVAVCVCVCV